MVEEEQPSGGGGESVVDRRPVHGNGRETGPEPGVVACRSRFALACSPSSATRTLTFICVCVQAADAADGDEELCDEEQQMLALLQSEHKGTARAPGACLRECERERERGGESVWQGCTTHDTRHTTHNTQRSRGAARQGTPGHLLV